MQRRAAAIYFVFFLVVGAAAYAYIGVAQSTQQPGFDLDGTTLESGENTTIGGTEYTVTEVGHEESADGHGGGGEGELVATLAWTNGSEEQTEELQEGSNVTLADGNQYFVHFPNDHAVSLVPIDQYDDYQATVSEREYFDERMNGLWGIVIISGSAAFLILSMAYMPHRG